MFCTSLFFTSHHRTIDHRENIWAILGLTYSGAFTSGFSDFQQWWKFLQVGYGLCLVRLGWMAGYCGNAPVGYNNPTLMGGIPVYQRITCRFSRIRKSLAKRPWVESWRSEVASRHVDAMVMCLRKLRQKEWLKSCNPWDQRRCNTFWTGKRTCSRRRWDIMGHQSSKRKHKKKIHGCVLSESWYGFEMFWGVSLWHICFLLVMWTIVPLVAWMLGISPIQAQLKLKHVETVNPSETTKSSLEPKTNSWDDGYVV